MTVVTGRRRSGSAAVTATAAVLLLTACGGGGGDADAGADGGEEGGGGTELTMWVRHTEGDIGAVLAEAYSETHETQINVTIVPSGGYQQKVGAAASSGGLPDLLAADVVYSPNYVDQGLYVPITEQVTSLPFFDDLTPAHSEAASLDDEIYGVPLIVDSSVLMYNKDLFEAAGLDPEAPPTDFAEMYEYAEAIRGLGGDTYGFYFAGNCPGCNAYTGFPYAAAADTPPFQDDGATASFDNEAFNAMFDMYKRMFDEGIVPESAKGDDGSTWPVAFNAGQVGMIPIGSFNYAAMADVDFEWGVAPLPAPDGGASATFVGGDVIGITRDSENVDAAWDFLEWVLSEEAQVEVIAASGNLPSRVDLADNEYSSQDPRIVTTIEGLANGYTPSSTVYGETVNDANGPWLIAFRDYIFNGETDALATAEEQIQGVIDEAQ